VESTVKSGSYSVAATLQIAQVLSSPGHSAQGKDEKHHFEDLDPQLQNVLRAQLRQSGDASAAIELPTGFLRFQVQGKTDTTLTVTSVAIPKRSYDESLAQQPEPWNAMETKLDSPKANRAEGTVVRTVLCAERASTEHRTPHRGLCALLIVASAHAGPRTSANYSIAADTADAGGKRATSASYTNDGSVGLVAGIVTVAAPAETAKGGYISQLYDVTGLTLTAATLNVNEGTIDQLAISLHFSHSVDGKCSVLRCERKKSPNSLFCVVTARCLHVSR